MEGVAGVYWRYDWRVWLGCSGGCGWGVVEGVAGV